jgi:phenylpropionate dioxygenase-like ring-hydroxylating dioxygenase large terminal subunit
VARTLLTAAYTSEEFFALERERVFGSTWVTAGCADQLREPGDVLATEVAGRSVFVLRTRTGTLRAFYNVCRHRGTRLLRPEENRIKRFIRCPYHSWAYDHEGACIGTPLFTDSEIPDDQRAAFDMAEGEPFDRADYGLLPVAVEAWGPLVFVNLGAAPAPLTEHLGDLVDRTAGHRLAEWTVARVGTYEIAANYKLIGENFMEYYHLPWVHPGLVKVSPIDAHYRWQGTGMYSGFCTTPIAPDTDNGGWGGGLPPLTNLAEDDAVSARFAWVFPNVAVNILPNHVFIIHAQPVSPRLTHETTYLLVHPEAGTGPEVEAAVDQLAAFWDGLNREDIDIVERVQQGLDSTPFPGGRLCYRFEEPLHRFQNMVIDHMVGEPRVPEGDPAYTVPMFRARARSATSSPSAARPPAA